MMLHRMRTLRTNQDGFALPEVVVSVLINGLCLTAIATAVGAFFAVQSGVKATSASISEMTISDTAWRADVMEATTIDAFNSQLVKFTAPNADGSCRTATWAVSDGSSRHSVTRTVHNYPATSAGACAGTAATPIAQTVVADTTVAAGFTYRNSSGRAITFIAGSPTLDAAPAPAGTTPERWATKVIGGATLTAVASASTDPTNIYISQTAVSSIGAVSPASFARPPLSEVSRVA